MTVSYELSQYYLGMNRGFCERSGEVLWKMTEDSTSRIILDEIKRLIHSCQDIMAAVRECECLKQYAGMFLGVNTELVLAAVLMDLLPETVRRMEVQGIPENVIKDTLNDARLWAEDYKKKTGREGIWETEWNLLVMSGRVLQLGRLQYERHLFGEPYYIYRNRRTKELKIMAESGIPVRADGRIQGTNGKKCDKGYTTVLQNENGILWGNRVDTETGVIVKKAEGISLKEYELLLAPGMPVINIHIPASGPLKPEQVDHSLRQAKKFLKDQGYPCKAGVCFSWLMDVMIGEFAPETGNICQFMRRFEKFPILSAAPSGIDRIFGAHSSRSEINRLPENTRLQSSLKSYLLGGGEIFDTGGILCMDDYKDDYKDECSMDKESSFEGIDPGFRMDDYKDECGMNTWEAQ